MFGQVAGQTATALWNNSLPYFEIQPSPPELRMNILVVTPYLPHPKSGHGTGVFMYGLLSRLAQRHRITVVSFCDEVEMRLAVDLQAIPIVLHCLPRTKGRQGGLWGNVALGLRRLTQFLLSIVLWQPYYVGKYKNTQMASLVRELTSREPFDIVQIEFAHLGQHRKNVRSGITFLHEHDVAYRPAYRRFKKAGNVIAKLALFIEWCRWARYEPELARTFDHVLTVTEQDRRLVRWLSGSDNVSYLPRGVDVPEQCPPFGLRQQHTLVFVGTFNHQPNVDAVEWLLRDIFPLILRSHPQTVLHIIGSNPSGKIVGMASLSPGVNLHGYVDDVLSYLDTCTVFIAPLRFGGGVKIKNLHAMSRGIPIVTTGIGVEGIDGAGPETILVGNSAEQLSQHVTRLFENPAQRSSIGNAGYELAKAQYGWGSVIDRLERIYSSTISKATC